MTGTISKAYGTYWLSLPIQRRFMKVELHCSCRPTALLIWLLESTRTLQNTAKRGNEFTRIIATLYARKFYSDVCSISRT